MERISEDVLSRMRLSSSAMDAYFAASPDVRRFQESAARVDKMEVNPGGGIVDANSSITRLLLCP